MCTFAPEMKIIVDDKIPYIREALDRLEADVEYIPGADIKPDDVVDAEKPGPWV